MSVHNLMKHILENPSCRERVELQAVAEEVKKATGKKAKLLCDYFSVLRWLLSSYDQALVKSGQLSPYCVLYSGNIHEYGPRIKSFLSILTGIDVVPVFFIAGPPGSDVDEFKFKYELYKRDSEQSIQHSALVQQITAGYRDLLQSEWRMDEAALSQVRAMMKTYGAQVIQCLGEVNHQIIKYLRSHEEAMGVLTHNTDFAVANGSVLFLPQLFGLNVNSHRLTAVNGSIVCERIMPSLLAKSLRITERQLADLAVLCGNDNTKLFNHILLEKLGLDNHKLETITEWLQAREEVSCLLEYSNLEEILQGNSTYVSLLKCSYDMYYSSCQRDSNVDEVTLPQSKTKSLVEVVQKRVKEGSMQPSLLSIANGLYWRSVTAEPVIVGNPSIHDATVILRKTLYALMGLKQVTEHGPCASTRFTDIPVQVKFAVESGVQQLASLESLTTAEKFSVLFYLVVNQKKLIRSFNLQDLLTVACRKSRALKEDITTGSPGTAVLICASLLFIQHANRLMKPRFKVKIGETDALLIACLACACDIPPYQYPHLPSSRVVTISSWFTHVLDQVYLVASYLGLQEELPPPASIFSCLAYFPFHVAAFADSEEDATASLGIKGPYQLFDSVLDLEPVLNLRAILLNKPKAPNLAQIVELFESSLKAVSLYKDSLDLPTSKEVTFNSNVSQPERSDDFTFGSQICLHDTSVNSSSDGSVEYNELPSTQECQVSEEDLYFSQQNPSEDDFFNLEADHLDSLSNGQTPLLDVTLCDSVSSPVPEETPTTTTADAVPTQDVQPSHPPSTSQCAPDDEVRGPPHQTELPVMSHRETILQLIKDHKVVCIAGETGCGKSTKIPQFILDEAIVKDPQESCKILVTQPRRVAAIRLAERVAEERRERVGHTVGYCIGGERHRSSTTPITYCTIGYLLQSLVHSSSIIHKYTHIILDEIHERSIDADFTLLVIRELIMESVNTKVIVMSATLQGDLLVDYFERVMDCSIVSSPYFVGSKRYPVEVFCIDELHTMVGRSRSIWHPCQTLATQNLIRFIGSQPQENSLRGAATTTPQISVVIQSMCTELVISQGNLGESILIFLPGIAEITDYLEKLSSELISRDIDDHFSLFILHSQIPFDDQKEAFQTPPPNKVHVILATNIAESSITLPNLRMVINFGIYRQLQYNPKRHMSCLVKRWCSKSSCAQRAGRAGRVFEGIAVHLFSRRFYQMILSEHDPPEILTAPIAKLVLQAKQIGSKLGIPSPSDFLSLAIEPPSLEQLEIALSDLANLGAIVSVPGQPPTEEADITLLGHFSLSLPLELPLCRLVLFGVLFGIPTDAIVMAAAMSQSQDVFLLPTQTHTCRSKNEKRFSSFLDETLDSRVKFDGGQFSDHILVRNMFMEWIQFRNANQDHSGSKHSLVRQFCRTNLVRWERLLQLEYTVADIATHVSSLVPHEYRLHNELTTLASITHYHQGLKRFSFKDAAREHGPNVSCIDVHFCEDTMNLKALLVAAFSHQLMIGYRDIEALSLKDADSAVKTLNNMQRIGIDCTQSLLVRTQRVSTPLQLQQLAAEVLPHRHCDVRIADSSYYFLHFLPQFLSNPKTELMRAQAESRGESSTRPKTDSKKVWQDFHNETSVSTHKPSKDLYFFWQFGERRPRWKVEGVDVYCTRPQHPLAVSWNRLSLLREKVLPLTWRNPTGFLCEFDMSPSQTGPLLGVASIFEGREYRSYATAKGVTVLPSLSKSPVALLMVLAFQTHSTDVHILCSCSDGKIVGLKINSCRIPFPESCSLCLDDLVRINLLRGAMSTVLRSYSEDGALLPVELMKRVPSLLDSVLKQTPLSTPTANETGPTVESGPPLMIIRLIWESVFSSEGNIESDFTGRDGIQNQVEEVPSLSSFDYFPPIQCSMFESISVPLNVEAVVETETPFLFEVAATDTSHFQRKDRKIRFPRKIKRRTLLDAPPIEDKPLGSFKLSPLAQPFVPIICSVDPLETVAASANTNNNNNNNNSSVDVQASLIASDNMDGTQNAVSSHLPQSGTHPSVADGDNVAPSLSQTKPQNSALILSSPATASPLHDGSIHPLQQQDQQHAEIDPALLQQYKSSLLTQVMSNAMLLYQLVDNISISPTDGTLSFVKPITIGSLCQFPATTVTTTAAQSHNTPQHDDIKAVSQPSPSHLALEQLELQSTSSSGNDVEYETDHSNKDEGVVLDVEKTEKEQVDVDTKLVSPTVEELLSASYDEDSASDIPEVQIEAPGVYTCADLEMEQLQQAPLIPTSQPEDDRDLNSQSVDMQETTPVVSIKPRYRSYSSPPFLFQYQFQAPIAIPIEPRSDSCPPHFPLYQQQQVPQALPYMTMVEQETNSCPPPHFISPHQLQDPRDMYAEGMQETIEPPAPLFPLFQQQAPPAPPVAGMPIFEHEPPPLVFFPPHHQLQAPLAPGSQGVYGPVVHDMPMVHQDWPNICPPLSVPLYQQQQVPSIQYISSPESSSSSSSSSQYSSCPQLFPLYQLQAPPVPSTLAMQYASTLEGPPSHYGSCPQLSPPHLLEATSPCTPMVPQYTTTLPSQYDSCPQLYAPHRLEAAPPVTSTLAMQYTSTLEGPPSHYGSCPQLSPPHLLEAPSPQVVMDGQQFVPDMEQQQVYFASALEAEQCSYYSSCPALFPTYQLQAYPAPITQEMYGSGRQEATCMSMTQQANSCPPFFPLYHQQQAPPASSSLVVEAQETIPDLTVIEQAPSNVTLTDEDDSSTQESSCSSLSLPHTPSPEVLDGRESNETVPDKVEAEQQGSCSSALEVKHDSSAPLSPCQLQVPSTQKLEIQEAIPGSMEQRATSCPPQFSVDQEQAPPALVEAQETIPDLTLIEQAPSNVTLTDNNESSSQESSCPPLSLLPHPPSTEDSEQQGSCSSALKVEHDSSAPLPPCQLQASSTLRLNGRERQETMAEMQRANSCPPLFPLDQQQAPLASSSLVVEAQETIPDLTVIEQAPSNVTLTDNNESSSQESSCPPLSLLPHPPSTEDSEQQGSCSSAFEVKHDSSAPLPPCQLQASSTLRLNGRERQETMADVSIEQRANSCPPLFPLNQQQAPPASSSLVVEAQETIPDLTVIEQAPSNVTLTDNSESSSQESSCPPLSLLPHPPSTEAEQQGSCSSAFEVEHDSSAPLPPCQLQASSTLRLNGRERQETMAEMQRANSCPPLFPLDQQQAPPASSSSLVVEAQDTIPDLTVIEQSVTHSDNSDSSTHYNHDSSTQQSSCPPPSLTHQLHALTGQTMNGRVTQETVPMEEHDSSNQVQTSSYSEQMLFPLHSVEGSGTQMLSDTSVHQSITSPPFYPPFQLQAPIHQSIQVQNGGSIELSTGDILRDEDNHVSVLSPTEQAVSSMREIADQQFPPPPPLLPLSVPYLPPPLLIPGPPAHFPPMPMPPPAARIPQGSSLPPSGPSHGGPSRGGPSRGSSSSNPPKHSAAGRKFAQRNTQAAANVKPGPESTPHNQYPVVYPKPVPRYMGPPPLPNTTHQPPPSTQIPPPFGTGFVARYTTPPWISTMWPPSGPQEPNIPHKFVRYPREQPRHGQRNRQQPKPKNQKYNPLYDDCLLKFYKYFLQLAGETDLDILCRPVYCEYLERGRIATNERVLLSNFFLKKPDVFTISGERMAYKVKLSCHHMEDLHVEQIMVNGGDGGHTRENGIIPANLNGRLDQEDSYNGPIIDETRKILDQTSVTVSQEDSEPHAVEHFEPQANESDDHDITQTPQDSNGPETSSTISQESLEPQATEHFEPMDGHDAIHLNGDNEKAEMNVVNDPSDADPSANGDKRVPATSLQTESEDEVVPDSQANIRQEDGEMLSQPQVIKDLTSDCAPSWTNGQPSPLKEEDSSSSCSEELVFVSDKIRMAVKKYQEKDDDCFEGGQRALPLTDPDKPTESEIEPEEKLQPADTHEVSPWEDEGVDGKFLEALSVYPNDPAALQSDSLQPTLHVEQSKPRLKVNNWDTSLQDVSQEVDKAPPPAVDEPTLDTLEEQVSTADTASELATSQQQEPQTPSTTCYDEDCWQEEPFITFPFAGETKMNSDDQSAGKKLTKVKPLLGGCSKASSFSTRRCTTEDTKSSTAKIGTLAHITDFSREILSSCDSMMYPDLCEKYRQTFQHALPYPFYIPHYFFEERSSIFNTVYVRREGYSARMVSLVSTDQECKSQSTERKASRMKGRREKPRPWRRSHNKRVRDERTSNPPGPMKERPPVRSDDVAGYGEKRQKKSKKKSRFRTEQPPQQQQ